MTVPQQRGQHIQLTLAIQTKRLDGKRMILSPDGQELVVSSQPEPRPHLVMAIGKAYLWKEELDKTGLPIIQFAKREGVCEAQVRKLLPLVNLSPMILKQALTVDLPRHHTLDDLLHAGQNLDWNRQADYLGIKSKIALAMARDVPHDQFKDQLWQPASNDAGCRSLHEWLTGSRSSPRPPIGKVDSPPTQALEDARSKCHICMEVNFNRRCPQLKTHPGNRRKRRLRRNGRKERISRKSASL